ncbi:hypothetical protein [Micromonospora sp. LH3U1]|uniref:hypothetical protein n=1 Tax=Micromonospora sp. LH3U1 TaxID=3018339 RepID=UPI00234BCA0B|nr:hypothetical protein [Micromonospora sp. LH3U1]WCN84304.1 hypothetical protein PCA76_15225 [Micromonospora sp. LH3U1]
MTWSASTLLLDSNFATWADAITAARRYAQGEIAGATDSQRHRDEAVGGQDLANLAALVGLDAGSARGRLAPGGALGRSFVPFPHIS